MAIAKTNTHARKTSLRDELTASPLFGGINILDRLATNQSLVRTRSAETNTAKDNELNQLFDQSKSSLPCVSAFLRPPLLKTTVKLRPWEPLPRPGAMRAWRLHAPYPQTEMSRTPLPKPPDRICRYYNLRSYSATVHHRRCRIESEPVLSGGKLASRLTGPHPVAIPALVFAGIAQW